MNSDPTSAIPPSGSTSKLLTALERAEVDLDLLSRRLDELDRSESTSPSASIDGPMRRSIEMIQHDLAMLRRMQHAARIQFDNFERRQDGGFTEIFGYLARLHDWQAAIASRRAPFFERHVILRPLAMLVATAILVLLWL